MAPKHEISAYARIVRKNYLHIFAVIATLIVIASLVRGPMVDFFTTNPMPELIPYTPKRQTVAGGAASKISIGLHISNFREFDILKNKFIADFLIWFEFDPSAISLDTISKFNFDRGEIKSRSEPITRMIGNKLFAKYKARVEFASNLDHKFFPINDHRIDITIVNDYVSPDEALFSSSVAGFSISPSTYTGGWLPVRKSTHEGYARASLDKFDRRKHIAHPRVVFSIDFERAGYRKLFLIFVPIFLLFFLGLFSLIVDIQENNRLALTLSTASLTTLLGYRFVIENLSPKVGYFTLTDHLYTIFLGVSFVIFLLNIFSVQIHSHHRVIRTIKCTMFFIIQIMLLILWYWMLYHWVSIVNV